MNLWIEYHIDFWDFPVSGVGSYGCDYNKSIKVYFRQTNGGYCKTEDIKINEFLQDLKKEKYDINSELIEEDIVRLYGTILKDTKNDLCTEYREITTENFIISIDNCILSIFEKYRCDVYILPSDIMDVIDHNHRIFQKYVGYHTDHNPGIYKKYLSKTSDMESYKKFKMDDPNIILNNKICNIGFDNIKWY